jgi:hypothetical protein
LELKVWTEETRLLWFAGPNEQYVFGWPSEACEVSELGTSEARTNLTSGNFLSNGFVSFAEEISFEVGLGISILFLVLRLIRFGTKFTDGRLSSALLLTETESVSALH